MEQMWVTVRDFGQFTQFALCLITLVALWMHLRWSRRIADLGPTLLTTLGIFFCFAGIAWGLLDFNPADVRSSVPLLLNGIRTAFWASVFGIFCALTIKFRILFRGEPAYAEGASAGATIDDLANLLSRLAFSIAGSEDSSLLSQTKLMRSDSNDRLDRLSTSFDRFATTMAEANSKALIKALSEIIRDFNTKLTEQFGDNFKQLNAAVERLVTWQVQYEKQLNALIEQETATRKSMTEASLRYAELVNRSSAFDTVAQSLGATLKGLDAQRAHLHELLNHLGELIKSAAGGLPQIESKVLEMTQQMGAAMKNVTQSVQANNQQLSAALSKTLTDANRELNSHVKQIAEEAKKHVVLLDKALEEELTKSIESLGRQLAALSQKFVQDYTPLTQQLQRLIHVARA